ncbi:MAG: glycosyltransferase [Betaproteobacteria bacterium]|nr:glycosyltransferase [Betaproteobacteria bacterium]
MSAVPTSLSVVVRSMARPSLAAALASIAAQDYPATEVVVVAACGPAHPPLPERCGTFPLRLVPSAGQLPRPAAANAGLDAARGEWLGFLDDDDVFLPGHLSALMAARAAAPTAGVVHSYARGVFRDGHSERFGQPHALIQLYERNYVHLSTAVFARALVLAGCRFDETLPIHEDWDFFLQLAQRTRFHFVPQQSFEWHADAGDSGAGGGSNRDDARFAQVRDRVYAKWAAARDALLERVGPLLEEAGALAQSGQIESAAAKCRAALTVSPNDPWALNLLAMIQRSAGDLRGAHAAQELAVAIRPLDAGFVYNLALVCRAQGDAPQALRCCDRALALAPEFAPAQRLRAALLPPAS